MLTSLGDFTAAALCGMLLGVQSPIGALRASTPRLLDVVEAAGVSALQGSLRRALARLRSLDQGGVFCDPVGSPDRMRIVFQLHETVQYIALAAAHLSLDLAVGTTQNGRNCRKLALRILGEALTFSVEEVLPNVLNELQPWRAAVGYWCNLQLSIGQQLPVDRPVLAMMRKAQVYSSLWGAAVLVRESVMPRLSVDDIPVGFGKLMSALDGWLPNGPAGSQPGDLSTQRLSIILSRLQG